MPQVVDIVVGASGLLTFNPESVTVLTGTVLRFNFLGLNHTLTQSSLTHPCMNSTLFDTGFQQFNPSNISGKFIVDYEVKNQEPQWFYCAQSYPKSHCENGMLFSVNPGDKLRNFSENAKPPLGIASASSCTAGRSHYASSSGRPEATLGAVTPEISNGSSQLALSLALCLFIGLMGFA